MTELITPRARLIWRGLRNRSERWPQRSAQTRRNLSQLRKKSVWCRQEHLRQRIDDADVLALHAAEEAARSADAARTAVEERAAAAEKRAGDAAAAIALHINRAAQADMATAAQEKRAVQAEEQLMHHATREAETLALLHRAEEAARAADAQGCRRGARRQQKGVRTTQCSFQAVPEPQSKQLKDEQT